LIAGETRMKHQQMLLVKTVILSLHTEGAVKNRFAAPKRVANSTCLTSTVLNSACLTGRQGRFFALPTARMPDCSRQAQNERCFRYF